ncbi:MAG: hypothetical protein H7145_21130 [Akkermansiaceae bacterium]|nr:hypothetical protein [Armatimonadota bacterium]
MLNRNTTLLIASLLIAPLFAGCAPDETPDAERAAAKKTVQKANTAAADAQQRVKEGDAVFDAK